MSQLSFLRSSKYSPFEIGFNLPLPFVVCLLTGCRFAVTFGCNWFN